MHMYCNHIYKKWVLLICIWTLVSPQQNIEVTFIYTSFNGNKMIVECGFTYVRLPRGRYILKRIIIKGTRKYLYIIGDHLETVLSKSIYIFFSDFSGANIM